jgi:indole-3-glycerol phosphate synthase
LLIVRTLSNDDLFEMLDLTLDLGMFALVECFDEPDLQRLTRLLILRGKELCEGQVLAGLNCRNLSDLSIDPARFAQLKGHFPTGLPAIAESGLATPADAASVAALGYDGALVGASLMRSPDPFVLAQEMLAAGRAARQTSRASTTPTPGESA